MISNKSLNFFGWIYVLSLTLLFLSSCGENPLDSSVTGPEITIEQDSEEVLIGGSCDFGDTDIGVPKDMSFTINNEGNENLLLTGTPKVQLSGTDVAEFSVTDQPDSPVAPNSSTDFTIQFTPTDLRNRIIEVTIDSNDADESSFTFYVTRLTEPEINVKQGSIDVASGDTFDFGSVKVNGGEQVVFTIENQGPEDLNLTGGTAVAVSGTNADLFTVITQPTTLVGPGGTSDFTLEFSPDSLGVKTAEVEIECDDEDEGTYSFTVTGTGALPEINIKQNDTSIDNGGNWDLGSIMNYTPTDTVFIIENLGVVDLDLTETPEVTVGGTDSALFTVTVPPSTPIEPGETAEFTVRFTGSGTGAKSATLTIESNDQDEPSYTIDLSVTVTPWSKIVDSTDDVGDGCSLAVSGSSLYVSYYDMTNDELKFAKSTDDGVTWPAGSIKSVDTSGTYGGSATRVVVDGTTVYITYRDDSQQYVRLAKSTDGGATWPTLETVEAGYSPDLAVEGSTIHVCYARGGGIYHRKSTNGGTVWQPETAIDATNAGDPCIAASGDDLYVVYSDTGVGSLLFAKSSDGGANWPAEDMLIIEGPGGATRRGTRLVLDGTNLYVSYQGPNGVMFTRSTDAGDNWPSGNIKILSAAGGSHDLAVDGNDIYASYKSGSDDWIYFTKSTDSGASWDTGQYVAGGTSSSIAVDGSNAYIAIYDSGDLDLAKSVDSGDNW